MLQILRFSSKNRKKNPKFPGLSLGGPDDGIELTFFKERVLGLVHGALGEYLALDTIETPFANHQNSMWGDRKEAEQVQFAEVRVCRLLLYLQDRADIGRTILETVFADFLKKSAEFHSSSNSSSLKKSPRKIQQSLKNPRKPGDREGLYLDLNSVCSTSNKDDDVTSVTSSAAANASSGGFLLLKIVIKIEILCSFYCTAYLTRKNIWRGKMWFRN